MNRCVDCHHISFHLCPCLCVRARASGGQVCLKMGKNSSDRQQDAHGPEKDSWLNPGNGEKKRGRRYFLITAVFRSKKTPIWRSQGTFCWVFPLPITGQRSMFMQNFPYFLEVDSYIGHNNTFSCNRILSLQVFPLLCFFSPQFSEMMIVWIFKQRSLHGIGALLLL